MLVDTRAFRRVLWPWQFGLFRASVRDIYIVSAYMELKFRNDSNRFGWLNQIEGHQSGLALSVGEFNAVRSCYQSSSLH